MPQQFFDLLRQRLRSSGVWKQVGTSAKTAQINRNHHIFFGQSRQDILPNLMGLAKAMYQHKRFALTCHIVGKEMARGLFARREVTHNTKK
jgi:hypothetical protein